MADVRARRGVLGPPMAIALAVGLAGLPATALAHGDPAPAPEWPGILLAWSFEPLVLGGILLAAVAYWLGLRRVAAAHAAHPHPAWRAVAFGGGLLTIGVALTSPIERYADQLFSVHMVQHMLLQLVAAPLLLLGAPMTLALRVAPLRLRRRLLAVAHSRLAAALTFPLVGWLAFAGANWAWHFSPLYDQALESPILHDLQHVTLLGVALLFWWPVVAADPARWRLPEPARLFYLFLAMPQNSFLGVALMSASTALYPHYATLVRDWGPTVLQDQSLGGLLMWTVGDVCFLVAMGGVVVAWARREDRRTAREDARLERIWADRELADAASAANAAEPRPPLIS